MEQLLGRVLRMPYARRRRELDLNRAYAYLSEPSFGAAAQALTDKLVGMGFEEEEARDHIEPVQERLDPEGGLFDPQEKPDPPFTHTVTATPELLYEFKQETLRGVEWRESSTEGMVEITIAGRVDQDREQAIAEFLPERERKAFADAVATHRAAVKEHLSPAARGQNFNVPGLSAEIQGTLEFADTDLFMENHHWSLLDHSPKLDETEFTIGETARSFTIDLDGRSVTYQFTSEAEQLALDIAVESWTPENLVIWLDGQVRQIDLSQSELLRWLRQLVDHLHITRGMAISALMRCKFLLARKIENKIAAIRQKERSRVYQQCLFAPGARVEVSFDHAFTFEDGMYQDQRRYRGRWKPSKHFLGADNVPAFDGAEDGEEVQCAQVIDSLPQVNYWIRNVARHPNSFWLPTATDKFYPDFVALLDDGRLLVVEYKGAHIAEGSDTNEKRTIGALWERESAGRGLFLTAEKTVDGKDLRQQLLDKIAVP